MGEEIEKKVETGAPVVGGPSLNEAPSRPPEKTEAEKAEYQAAIAADEKKMVMIQRSTRTSMAIFASLHNFLRMKMGWYYSWHTRPASSPIHWILLLLYIVGLAGYIYFRFFLNM